MIDVNVYRYEAGQEILEKKRVPLSAIIPDDTVAQTIALDYLDRCGRYWLGGHDGLPAFLLMTA